MHNTNNLHLSHGITQGFNQNSGLLRSIGCCVGGPYTGIRIFQLFILRLHFKWSSQVQNTVCTHMALICRKSLLKTAKKYINHAATTKTGSIFSDEETFCFYFSSSHTTASHINFFLNHQQKNYGKNVKEKKQVLVALFSFSLLAAFPPKDPSFAF